MLRILRRAVPALVLAATAQAQDQEVQRALIQRDQQSAGFALQLKQSQEKPSPQHLVERQRLDNLSARQLQSVAKDAPPELRPYERQKAAGERQIQLAPPVPAY